VAEYRTIEVDSEDVGLAIREGAADGIRRYLPLALGLVVLGVPLCAFMAFAHFVLGAEWPPPSLLGGLGGLGLAAPVIFLLYSGSRSGQPPNSAPAARSNPDRYR
jgi:hypothetical protein